MSATPSTASVFLAPAEPRSEAYHAWMDAVARAGARFGGSTRQGTTSATTPPLVSQPDCIEASDSE
jgi:hypothetical protein